MSKQGSNSEFLFSKIFWNYMGNGAKEGPKTGSNGYKMGPTGHCTTSRYAGGPAAVQQLAGCCTQELAGCWAGVWLMAAGSREKQGIGRWEMFM